MDISRIANSTPGKRLRKVVSNPEDQWPGMQFRIQSVPGHMHPASHCESIFPFIPASHFVFCGDKTIVDADYLIDDQPRHLRSFHGTGILFSAPHNRKETGCCRVESWKEIRQLLLEGHGTAKRDMSREAGAAVPLAPPGSIAHFGTIPIRDCMPLN